MSANSQQGVFFSWPTPFAQEITNGQPKLVKYFYSPSVFPPPLLPPIVPPPSYSSYFMMWSLTKPQEDTDESFGQQKCFLLFSTNSEQIAI